MYKPLSFLIRPFMSEFNLPRNVVGKIVAQFTADRDRRRQYSPNYKTVKAMHDSIYASCMQARIDGDYSVELILCRACNDLWRHMEDEILGHPYKECKKRIETWIRRQAIKAALEKTAK